MGALHFGQEFAIFRGIPFAPFVFEKVKGTDMVLIAPIDKKIIPMIDIIV